VANKLGDPTAKFLGRITLNPLKHADLFGTFLFPLLGILFPGAGVLFGWGKPVPINSRNLKNPKRDFLWIALAGPLANILLALVAAIIFHTVINLYGEELMGDRQGLKIIEPLFSITNSLINLNVALALFNLLPIPPLDGSRILAGILPDRYADKIYALEQAGFFLMIIFLMTGIYRYMAIPIIFVIDLLKTGV
jgi:Zn-dependent protease